MLQLIQLNIFRKFLPCPNAVHGRTEHRSCFVLIKRRSISIRSTGGNVNLFVKVKHTSVCKKFSRFHLVTKSVRFALFLKCLIFRILFCILLTLARFARVLSSSFDPSPYIWLAAPTRLQREGSPPKSFKSSFNLSPSDGVPELECFRAFESLGTIIRSRCCSKRWCVSQISCKLM